MIRRAKVPSFVWIVLAIGLGVAVVRALPVRLSGGLVGLSGFSPSVREPSTAPGRHGTLLLFVTSEATDTIKVFRTDSSEPVATIAVGRDPHNLAASPDGRWVAVSDRQSREVSLLDTNSLREVARVRVGRQPHDLAFSPGSDLLYVGDEKDPFIAVIDVPGKRWTRTLRVSAPQHDIALRPDGRILWFTVNGLRHTNGARGVGLLDVEQGREIARLATGENPHDVIFSPDGRQVWVTNSGVIGVPDSKVTIIDAEQRRILAQIAVGSYPFHAPKRFKDGNFVPPSAGTFWFSDQGQNALQWVDLATRRVTTSVPVGRRPFHVSLGPDERLYVANSLSDSVTVIDARQRRAVGSLPVARPHGLAVVAPPGSAGQVR